MCAGENIIACCVGHICLEVFLNAGGAAIVYCTEELGAAAEGMVGTLLTCTSNTDLYITYSSHSNFFILKILQICNKNTKIQSFSVFDHFWST